MKILGAGLSGLIAGVLNQNAFILEPFSDRKSHQALLRFRTPDIGIAVGIPFKEVVVYKGIWDLGPVPLSPKYITQYARKVSDKITARSIQHLTPETRWIAPVDFQEQLKEICTGRIEYDCDIESAPIFPDPIISTLPMNVVAKWLNIPDPLKRDFYAPVIKPIYVSRYNIENCDIYMTTYHPTFTSSMYRSSISGETLIIESTEKITNLEVEVALSSLGLNGSIISNEVENFEQPNGKMTAIDEDVRKAFILKLTLEQGIYSLGRFAIWKNIVLDDVYKDILRIKAFMNKTKYDYYREHK